MGWKRPGQLHFLNDSRRDLLSRDHQTTIRLPGDQLATIRLPSDQLATMRLPGDQLATIRLPRDQLATMRLPAGQCSDRAEMKTRWPVAALSPWDVMSSSRSLTVGRDEQAEHFPVLVITVISQTPGSRRGIKLIPTGPQPRQTRMAPAAASDPLSTSHRGLGITGTPWSGHLALLLVSVVYPAPGPLHRVSPSGVAGWHDGQSPRVTGGRAGPAQNPHRFRRSDSIAGSAFRSGHRTL